MCRRDLIWRVNRMWRGACAVHQKPRYCYASHALNEHLLHAHRKGRISFICCQYLCKKVNKKLIKRWDSERELSLRRHRTVQQNTIVSCINFATDRRGYVLERSFTKFSEITQCNGHYAVQGHRFWYQSKAHIRLPISDWYKLTSYLAPFPSYGWLLVTFSIARGECLTITLSLGVTPANIAINDTSLKLDYLAYITTAGSIGVSSTTFT